MPDMSLPTPPELRYLASLRIEVDTPRAITPPGEATRRIIPITGGSIDGPGLRAEILPFGADFQTQRSATGTELDARYMARTENGDLLFITNLAVRAGSADDIAALAAGEPVPPERIYFRCSPRISTDSAELAHLNDRVLLGSGHREPDAVLLDVWVVE